MRDPHRRQRSGQLQRPHRHGLVLVRAGDPARAHDPGPQPEVEGRERDAAHFPPDHADDLPPVAAPAERPAAPAVQQRLVAGRELPAPAGRQPLALGVPSTLLVFQEKPGQHVHLTTMSGWIGRNRSHGNDSGPPDSDRFSHLSYLAGGSGRRSGCRPIPGAYRAAIAALRC